MHPKGAYVAGAGGATTSGPLSFMDVFYRMYQTVSSAGSRRGAQMATFDVNHPDVIEFIQVKREDGRLRNFNLSVLVADAFMEAVNDDAAWPLSFPVTDGYVVNDQGQVACRIYRTVQARKIWDAMMTSTYDYAEPGLILVDNVNRMNNNWFCEDIRATNP